jgi:hypothetical protein
MHPIFCIMCRSDRLARLMAMHCLFKQLLLFIPCAFSYHCSVSFLRICRQFQLLVPVAGAFTHHGDEAGVVGGERSHSSACSDIEQSPITERYPYQPPTGQQCRVFISHAGEQKAMVDFLHEKLEKECPALKGRVFLDERSLQGGDAAMEKMYHSLRDALVGK